MKLRTKAREKAIQAIYSIFSEIDGEYNEAELLTLVNEKINQVISFDQTELNESQISFTKFLLENTLKDLPEIDKLIKKYAHNWDFSRISLIDKSVLRIAIMEMVFTDTPNKVVINEAIELAGSFSGAKSSKFINGILDAIMHKENKND